MSTVVNTNLVSIRHHRRYRLKCDFDSFGILNSSAGTAYVVTAVESVRGANVVVHGVFDFILFYFIR